MQGLNIGNRFSNKKSANAGRGLPLPAADSERLPLYAELIQRADKWPRRVVMDLAPISPKGISVFNDLQCRLQSVDLLQELPKLASATSSSVFTQQVEALLPNEPQHRANVVMCWDFLNYLPRGGMSLLMEHIASRMRPDGLLHLLIAYSDPLMSSEPSRYLPLDKENVQIQPGLELDRKAPRYAPKELLRYLPRFDIEKVMLLRNGYQEYLLRLKPLD